MGTFTLFHTNAMDTAILAGGSWRPNLPLSNLISPRTTNRARSYDAQLSNTQFTADLIEVVSALGIQVIATNMSSAARYRLSWYADAARTILNDITAWIPVGQSIDWLDTNQWFDWLDDEFWLGAVAFIDPDHQGLDIRHNFAAETAVQYLNFEFDDQTNPDGFIELGYVMIGHPFVPSINVGPEPGFSRVSLTSMVEAVGGSQYFNRRGSRKRLTVGWAVLPKEEVLGDIDTIIRIQDINRPVYVDIDPENNIASGRAMSFLARIQQLPEAKLLQAFFDNDGAATIGFEFIQIL